MRAGVVVVWRAPLVVVVAVVVGALWSEQQRCCCRERSANLEQAAIIRDKGPGRSDALSYLANRCVV